MAKKRQTFKDRLALLMKGERPYTWARKVGIEKGLFQYYWQKGNIPTYENLVKIHEYTGCSLDWLLMGKVIDPGQLDKLAFVKESDPEVVKRLGRRVIYSKKLDRVYDSKDGRAIKAVESLLDVLDS